MSFDISKTCCFTGHRFKNVNFFEEKNKLMQSYIKNRLKKEILKSLKENFCHFISGGAIGVDTWALEIILKIKKQNPIITYEVAVPCVGQSDFWSEKNKAIYKKIIDCSDKTTLLNNRKYFGGCMQIRNKYMVDNSSLVIGVYDGVSRGGTKYTIDYAKKCGKNIILIDTFK